MADKHENEPAPPSSICFSVDDVFVEEDERSELTDPDVDNSNDNELGANPYFYRAIGDISPSVSPSAPKRPSRRRSSLRSSTKSNKSSYSALRLFDGPDLHRQEIMELKLQIARQQERLDALSSELGNCELEKEALETEKAVLVDELSLSRESRSSSDARRKWFKGGSASDGGGSMQLLVDANAKLMTDNARLQVVADVIRKSFRRHIDDSRRIIDMDRRSIEVLRRENEDQRRQLLDLSARDRTVVSRDPVLFKSFGTTTTYPPDASGHTITTKGMDESISSVVARVSELISSTQDFMQEKTSKRRNSSPDLICSLYQEGEEYEEDNMFVPSGDDWLEDDDLKDICREGSQIRLPMIDRDYSIKDKPEDTVPSRGTERVGSAPNIMEQVKRMYAPRRQSEDLLVDFGEDPRTMLRELTTQRCRPIAEERLCQSHTERSLTTSAVLQPPRRKSEDLLVEFGSRRRNTNRTEDGTARLWTSLKLRK